MTVAGILRVLVSASGRRGASPIAPRRPLRRVAHRRGDPAGRPYLPCLHISYRTPTPTTVCRCASPIAPRRPLHRVAHRVRRPSRRVGHRVGATRRVAPTYRASTYRTVPQPPPRYAGARRPLHRVAHCVGLPIVGATRRVAPTYRASTYRTVPQPPPRYAGARRPSRASPIAPGWPSGRGDPAGRPYLPCLHISYRTPTPTTVCRCASPIAPRRPLRRVAHRRGDPAGRPYLPCLHISYRTPTPTTVCRCASPIAPRRPLHRVAHCVGLPIVGATRRVAPTYRASTYRTVPQPPPRYAGARRPLHRVAHRVRRPLHRVAHQVGATRRVAHNGRGTVCRASIPQQRNLSTTPGCPFPIASYIQRSKKTTAGHSIATARSYSRRKD